MHCALRTPFYGLDQVSAIGFAFMLSLIHLNNTENTGGGRGDSDSGQYVD